MYRILLLHLIYAVFTVEALACSVSRNYVVPSNFELVQEADAIVLAEAVSDQSEPDLVSFKILETITGQDVSGHVTTYGQLARSTDVDRSNFESLSDVHPDAFLGSCNRYLFSRNVPFVLFLKKEDGDWNVIYYPFARTFEDVPDVDSLWVWTLTQYAEVKALPNDRDRFHALLELSTTPPDAPKSWQSAFTEDISKYLETASPRKSIEFIEAQLSESGITGDTFLGALGSLLIGDHENISGYFAPLETDRVSIEHIGILARYYIREKSASAFEGLVEGRLNELIQFGSVESQIDVSEGFKELFGELSIDVIVEGYWAFRQSRISFFPSYENLHTRLKGYSDIVPALNPALAVMQANYYIESPVIWAESNLFGRGGRFTELAIKVVAEASDSTGWKATKRIVCEDTEYRLNLIEALPQTESSYALAWIRAIWAQHDLSMEERAAVKLALHKLAFKYGDASRHFFEPVEATQYSLRGDQAWEMLSQISSGEGVPLAGTSMRCE